MLILSYVNDCHATSMVYGVFLINPKQGHSLGAQSLDRFLLLVKAHVVKLRVGGFGSFGENRV
jgi:hypothetical protein